MPPFFCRMQHNDTTGAAREPDDWLSDLREKFVAKGFDQRRVELAIDATLIRFRDTRMRSFLPLLVERGVQQALRAT